MKTSTALLVCAPVVLLLAVVTAHGGRPQTSPGPELLFPSDYRQWVYLSSGLDMQYKSEPSPSCKEGRCPPLFENVFVRPDDYAYFFKNRVWPIGTVMVLEKRCSASKVSIDTNGSIQQKLFMVAASQKAADNGWNYYLFGGGHGEPPLSCIGPDQNFSGQRKTPASNIDPKIAPICWQCHRDNGKVDNTFIQFYPTLNSVSIAKGE
jgi:hypothetical protein